MVRYKLMSFAERSMNITHARQRANIDRSTLLHGSQSDVGNREG